MFPGIALDRSRCCGVLDECYSRLMCARTSWASVIPLASRTWRKVVRASANLPVFHSMPPGLAMASLSPAMRRRAFVISTANIQRKWIYGDLQLRALVQGPVGRLVLSKTLQLFLARLYILVTGSRPVT